MASVPTGTPRGICTIDSSESTPRSILLSTGTPSTGSIVIAASIPGKMRRPAGAGDQDFQAPALGLASIAKQSIGRPMRRDHLRLVRNAQLGQQLAAWRIVSQSDLLPITTPTSGASESWSSCRPVQWTVHGEGTSI